MWFYPCRRFLRLVDDLPLGGFKCFLVIVCPRKRGGWLEEVSERCHDVGSRERVGHLVYKPEPRSYIRGRRGYRKFSNCSREFAGRCGSDLKSCKLDCVLRKDELVWIQGDSVHSAQAQPVCSVMKRLFDVGGPQ